MQLFKILLLLTLSFSIISCSLNSEEWQSINSGDIQGSWFFRGEYSSLESINSFIDRQEGLAVEYSSFNYLDFETTTLQWYYADSTPTIITCDLDEYSYNISNSKITILTDSASIIFSSKKYKASNKTYMYLLKDGLYSLFSKKVNIVYKESATQDCEYQYIDIFN